MKQKCHTQKQAILDLLYIGNEDQEEEVRNPVIRKEFTSILSNALKPKSNTFHLRNTKNIPSKGESKTQTPQRTFHYIQSASSASDNKENLKKLLKKLEHSPEPLSEHNIPLSETRKQRAETHNSEKCSREKPYTWQSPFLQTPKKYLDKFMRDTRDRDFIKTLIKSKIVQKLKRTHNRKGQKKASNFNPIDSAGQTSLGLLQPSYQQRYKASKSKSNFLYLLQQQKKINSNTLTLSKKNSRVTIKKLLM